MAAEVLNLERLVDFVTPIAEYVTPEQNVLQPVWDFVRQGPWGEDALRSPLFPVVMSVVFYFSCILPFMIVDLWGKEWHWTKKYKIQPDKEVTWPMVRNTMVITFWNHLLYVLPSAVGQYIYTPPTPLPPVSPGLWEFTWHIVASLIIFDFQYFVWHWLHHKVRFLYKHFHALHHQYHSPFSWVTQYLHPWELITVGILTTINPWLFDSHCFTIWVYMLISIAISVEAHCGFVLPWSPMNWVPFGLWGGAVKHDLHHQRPYSNFEPFFCIWDRLAGTEFTLKDRQRAIDRREKIEYDGHNGLVGREVKKFN
ncbi:CH25H [Branchiostoma lanceolatum]|uniref:CH25H protein n=1 Tax=Branchiostoma lanceolatum TaxID=7740 RepID=A0A8K0EK18_BRALA|nr:CH25H [Branchiostoma lanceolatum]